MTPTAAPAAIGLGVALLDVISDCVWLKGTDGRYATVNAAFAALVARPKSAILGSRSEDLFPPQTALRFRRRDEAAMASDVPVTAEELITDGTGRTRWLEIVTTPVRDATGVLLGTSGAARDVTARKQSEVIHKASAARLRAIFDESPFGIGLADEDGRITEANAACRRMLGVASEKSFTLRVTGISNGLESGADIALYRELVEGQRDSYTVEATYGRESGEPLALRATCAAMRDETGSFAYSVVMLEDVTEIKRAESQLQSREEEFRQAQKMEAVGRLAGGVAHDFNNLLTVIIAHADFLRRGGPTSPEWQDDITQIADAAFQASGLTRQLLAFGRKQVLQPRAISLNEVVDALAPMLGRSLGEDVRLELALDAALPQVHADPGQIEQVIVNLVANARDAMPRGGTLTIATHVVEPTDTRLVDGADAPGGCQGALSVRDTGVGIDPTVERRIFEPFFTTKDPGRGTGLGLSTVYGIMRQSGGAIAVDTRVGAGTTFTITLPLAASGTDQLDDASPFMPPTPRGGQTILLVEDEPVVRQLAKRILSQRGYEVMDAASGADALRCISETAGPIDLLLTDVVMPGMSGRELAAAATRLRPDMGVVFTSGYTGDEVFERGLLPAGASFVAKPFTGAVLLAAVRTRLDSAARPVR